MIEVRRFFSSCINIDSRLCLRIYSLSGKRFFDLLFYTLSRIGDGWIYAVMFGVYLAVRTREALERLPAFCAAFVSEAAIYTIIKKNVRRIRPFKTIENITSLIMPPDEFSFPSGHTAGAAVFTVLCSSVFPQALFSLIIYTSAVGFSRVYNGVHYPGDVFAGAALGTACAKASLLIF